MGLRQSLVLAPALMFLSPAARGGEDPSCPLPSAEIQVIFSDRNVGQTSALFAGQIPAQDPREEPLIIAEPGEIELYAAIVSQLAAADGGIQGWSLSFRVLGDIQLVAVSTAGTVSAPVERGPPGLRDGGFEKTQIINPAVEGSQGAVSAVVLSFNAGLTLDPVGTATVLALRLEGAHADSGELYWVKSPADGGGASATLGPSLATVSGQTRPFSCLQGLDITFVGESEPGGCGSADPDRPVLAWEKTFGASSLAARTNAVVQTPDGGFLAAGSATVFRTGVGFDSDVYLLRTDREGASVWERAFGGVAFDFGQDLRATADGGCLVAGQTFSFGAGDADAYVLRINAEGELLWQRTFGGGGPDGASEVQVTRDGGLVLTGTRRRTKSSRADVYLVRADAAGELVWERTLGGEADELGLAVAQIADGFIVAGSTVSDVTFIEESLLIRTDAEGHALWQRTYARGAGNAVLEATDGGFVLAGDSLWQVYLLRTDARGDSLWERRFGNGSSGDVLAASEDGGFIVAGTDRSSGPITGYLLKTDSAGSLRWETRFVPPTFSFREPAGLALAGGGTYVVAGGIQDGPHGRLLSYLAELAPASGQVPGDANQDGRLDISDGVCELGFLFQGTPDDLPCGDGGAAHPANLALVDINGDRLFDVSDCVYLFAYLFLGSAAPSLGTHCTAIEGCPGVCAP